MHSNLFDIRVLVDAVYKGFHKAEKHHIFSYEIEIINDSELAFQLLGRHWEISDGLNYFREVNGEGVIGMQPEILAGDRFKYNSWSSIPTSLGYMKGSYSCIFLQDDQPFELEIPTFPLICPYRYN